MNQKARSKWLKFSSCGEQLVNLPFVAFKVPIENEQILKSIPATNRFTLTELFAQHPNIGLIIDLTNTTKYYDAKLVKRQGIKYCKIFCDGHGTIPKPSQISMFTSTVDEFRKTYPNKLIGVHCTHGLNRTGYLICHYLIKNMGLSPSRALKTFQEARGHKIERKNYVDNLYAIGGRLNRTTNSGSLKSYQSNEFSSSRRAETMQPATSSNSNQSSYAPQSNVSRRFHNLLAGYRKSSAEPSCSLFDQGWRNQSYYNNASTSNNSLFTNYDASNQRSSAYQNHRMSTPNWRTCGTNSSTNQWNHDDDYTFLENDYQRGLVLIFWFRFHIIHVYQSNKKYFHHCQFVISGSHRMTTALILSIGTDINFQL